MDDEVLFKLLPERFLFHQRDKYATEDNAQEIALHRLPHGLDQRNMQLALNNVLVLVHQVAFYWEIYYRKADS